MYKTPQHIQDELTQLIDELMLNEDPFDEIHDSKEARLVDTSYFVSVHAGLPWVLRKYYVMQKTTYEFDGIKAVAERAHYLVEPTSSTTFQTFEL